MFQFKALIIVALWISFSQVSWADEEYWEYTFRPGDSLWAIADQYTTSPNNWLKIQKINEMNQRFNKEIQPGTRVLIPISLLKNKPVPARVVALTGEVFAFKTNGDKSKLLVGSLLFSGDKVVTLKHQYLVLQFADGSQLQVLSESEVVLDKLSHHKKTGMVDTLIRLNSGQVNTQVKKQTKDSRYEIKTPSAITAVRGTAFRVSAESVSKTLTSVTEGKVNVSAGQDEKLVNLGFGLVAEKGKPLSDPIKLLDPPDLMIQGPLKNGTTKISWKSLSGAKEYRYELATDEQFNQVTLNQRSSVDAIELDELTPGHYYFRVRGVDQYQLEGLDSMIEFIIPEKVVNVSTTKGKDLTAPIFLINW